MAYSILVVDYSNFIQKMIKNFDQRGVTLDTNAEGPDMPTTKGKRTKGIGAMAKRATKKRS